MSLTMPVNDSLLDSLLSLPVVERLTAIQSLSSRDAEALLYDWMGLWARDNQRPPSGPWRSWLIMSGRGYGKTRTGAEWVRWRVESGGYGRIALVAPTAADARDVMVEGESGMLAIAPSWNRPLYEPSKRRLTWANGAIATTYSADEPDRLRGPQHDSAWGDEIAAWRDASSGDATGTAWNNLMLGLRIGPNPQAVGTTTPRPVKLIMQLVENAATVVTRGSTFENRANLSPAFIADILRQYKGTRLGRQELYGELLTDMPGALWTRSMFDDRGQLPDLARVVIAVDPAATAHEESDNTGIIAAGKGVDARGYVLADRSCKLSPDGWARRAVAAYHEFGADRIVAEGNNGGEMVRHVIQTVDPKIKVVIVHASRGKVARAEPVAALYEQQRITHTEPFDDLEDELCTWTPESGASPDRLDALVWAITDLMLGDQRTRQVVTW